MNCFGQCLQANSPLSSLIISSLMVNCFRGGLSMETVSASVISLFSWASFEFSQTSILIDVIVDMFTDGSIISFSSCLSIELS